MNGCMMGSKGVIVIVSCMHNVTYCLFMHVGVLVLSQVSVQRSLSQSSYARCELVAKVVGLVIGVLMGTMSSQVFVEHIPGKWRLSIT